jgi:GH15 family glucan-1,4-alpha-glucosidase
VHQPEDQAAEFAPLRRHDGYLPIEDHGLIGDGSTAALVGRDGSVDWLCVPRFDSPPLFAAILDRRSGGRFVVTLPEVEGARQRYEPDTGVLVTELKGPRGVLRITDCLVIRPGGPLGETVPRSSGELLRSLSVLDGEVDVEIAVEPRGGADARRHNGSMRLVAGRHPGLELHLDTDLDLDRPRATVGLRRGDQRHLVLRWGGMPHKKRLTSPGELLSGTLAAWRSWARCIAYQGPQEPLVRRSAITLKLLDYFDSGAIVAAPTSSLPEWIGGERNWDYRYAWVRDVAFSVYALRRIGMEDEAWGFLGWVLDAIERDGRAKVLYTLDGLQPELEWEDDLEGYRRSRPVRWGNGAADQVQHDAYGEIIDCAYQWAARQGALADLWPRLAGLVEQARERWDQPDHGIWEVRTPGRVFTYSAAMCQVALDRGARLVDRLGLAGDAAGWRREAERIRRAILDDAWDDDLQAIGEVLGGGGYLDASVLSLPLRRVVDANHPKMVATVAAVADRLGAGGGLLYRYLHDKSPDGLEGEEGAFLLCSFWLVDNLAYQGRVDEAMALYESLCARANPLGLLSEQIHPTTGEFLGNFPQAFSHIGVISSGVNLARVLARR